MKSDKWHCCESYRPGWLTAALVAFALCAFMALLRGAEFKPVPPPSAGVAILPPGAVSSLEPGWQGPLLPSSWSYTPPTNELHTVSMQGTNESGYFIYSVEWHGELQTSTNFSEWQDCQSDSRLSKNIVSYMRGGESRRRFFRAAPAKAGTPNL